VNVYKGIEQRRSMSVKVKTAFKGGVSDGTSRVTSAYGPVKVARKTHEPKTDKVAVVNRGMPETEVKSKVVKVMW